jgi:predicted HTH domain antitoxin
MKEITLNLPSSFDLDEAEIIKFLAAKLYEAGRLSLGQAAEMAGLSKTEFAEILSDYDVSLINYSSAEIIRDASQF